MTLSNSQPADGSDVTSAGNLHVSELCKWQEVEKLRNVWEQLAARQNTPTVFNSWQWSNAWWNAYGEASRLKVLVVRRGDGEVVGIAPLYIARTPSRGPLSLRVVRFIGSNEDSGALDILADPDYQQRVWQAVLEFLQASSAWDMIEFNNIESESDSHRILVQELKERTWQALYFRAPFSRIRLPNTWEDFLTGLSRKLRYSVGRTHRRLGQEFNVVYRRCESVDEIPLFLTHLYDLHSKRWASKGIAGAFNEKRKQFYLELSKSTVERAWLDLWELEISGQVAAVEFGCRYGTSRYALQAGYDPEFASYGVGQGLESFLIKHTIESNGSFYELMAGTESYKLRWGAEVGWFGNFRCARPWTMGSLGLHLALLLKRNSLYRQSPWKSE